LVRVQNGALYDVPNRTQSPFRRDTLFIAAPVTANFFSATIPFTIPADKVITDLGISQLSVNWDNGNGFQNYAIGQTVNIEYATNGVHTIQLRWADAAGRILQTQFEISVQASFSIMARAACTDPTYNSTCSQVEQIVLPNQSTGATVTTFFACPDGQLRRPLFILDGIDFNPFGNTSTAERLTTGLALLSPNSMSPSVSELLKTEGYDLVFVDWHNGGQQDVRFNSQLFRQILNTFNERKRNNGSTQKNMVIGMSMGGVVGKHALRTMELANPTRADGGHDVETFIGFDAPMQGANIPLSLQFFVNDLSSLNILGRRLRDINQNFNAILTTLQSTAAQQLLVLNGFILPPFISAQHEQFYTEFRNLGNLQKCEYRAVSNGSMRSITNLPPNSNLLDVRGNANTNLVVTISLNSQLNALPAAGDGTLRTIYSSSMRVFLFGFESDRAIQTVNRSGNDVGINNYDNCPGGKLPLDANAILAALPTGINIENSNLNRITFIPAVSALDIRLPERQNLNFNTSDEQRLVGANITANKGYIGARGETPLDNEFTVRGMILGAENQAHVNFSPRIINFLLQELNKTTELAANAVLTNRTYNFGATNDFVPDDLSTPRKISNLNYTVTASNTGRLWVNRTGRIQFTDIANNPNNDPQVPFTLSIKGGCQNAGVVLENGGTFHLGEASIPNRTVVRVGGGGFVRVKSGGNLKLENTAQLIIESGGRLILEPGANIHLLGNEAKIIFRDGGCLVLNGQIDIPSNVSFQFEQNGQVSTEMPIPSKGILRGVNQDHRIINIVHGGNMTVVPNGNATAIVRFENGLIERAAGLNTTTANHIIVQPLSIIQSNNIKFLDNSLGNRRFIMLNGHNIGDFEFESSTFLNAGIAVFIFNPNALPNQPGLAYPWHRNGFRVNVAFRQTNFTNTQVIKADRAFIIELDHCNVINGDLDVSNAYWVNIHNNTVMRGNWSGSGVKVKSVVHTELYDNSVIDQYSTGIEAINGYNHNISLYRQGSIQQCMVGIHLNGGIAARNDDIPLDWGMIYMDCSRLLDNAVAIQGTDILFNMYGRGSNTNMIRQNPVAISLTPHLQVAYQWRRNLNDIWLHGNYWHPTVPAATPVNSYWRFEQTIKAESGAIGSPWAGTLHVNEPGWGDAITDANHGSVQNCGGVNLRSPESERGNLMAQNTIIFADGQYRNVKIQQDVAMHQIQQQNLPLAETLFEPIARLSDQARDTASVAVKHYIDVARVMAVRSNNGLAREDFGWLPEATVYFDKPTLSLKVYPNPAQDFCRVELPLGQVYDVGVYDAVGRQIAILTTQGDTNLDTKDWKSGIYMIQALNQKTQQKYYAKMIIQK
jgi:Secretion system C-terminal sorting domain